MNQSLTKTVIYHVDTGASLEPLVKDILANADGDWSEKQIRECIQDMLNTGLLQIQVAQDPMDSDRDGTGYLRVTEAGWAYWRSQ